MGAPTVVTHGSEEQKQRYLRPLFTGEEIWCQLFSEPGAGSDVAGLSTRAVRDGDEWIVNGQKVWTTLAHVSRWGMLVARTDPEPPKHKGMTYFVVDMQRPASRCGRCFQITGEAEFNEVFFTDVRIPDAERLGDVGEGWRVSLTTLMNERVAIGGAIPPRGSGFIGELVKVYGRTGAPRRRRPRRADAAVDPGRGAAAHQHPGQPAPRRRARPGPEGSIGKLAMAELNKDISEFAVDLLGAEGMLSRRLPDGPARDHRAVDQRPAGVPAVAGQLDRGRHHRDHEEHPRRAGARPAGRRPRRQGPPLEPGPAVVSADGPGRGRRGCGGVEAGDIEIEVGGEKRTASFAPDPENDGRPLGLVSGLPEGDPEITARAGDARAAVTLTAHPRSGFSLLDAPSLQLLREGYVMAGD